MPDETKRLFIGVKVDARIREMAAGAKEALGDDAAGAKWIKPENIHMTLRFLGDRPEAIIVAVLAAMEKAVLSMKTFSVNVGSVGAFPSFKGARVLWLGAEASEPVLELYSRTTQELESIGFEPEERQWSPHITIARMKKPSHISPEKAENAVTRSHDWKVAAITLFESSLTPQGSLYQAVGRAVLGGDNIS